MTPTQGTAGWYDDPTAPGVTRYWDGDRWTERSFGEPLPVAPAGPSGPPGAAPAWGRTPPRRVAGPTTTDGYAIASLVLGILGFFCGIGAIAAICLGVTARKRIRLSYGRRTGDGLALAGILMGAFWLVLTVVVVAVVVASGPPPAPPPS